MKLPKLPKLPSLKSLHLPSRITMERLLIVSAAALVVVLAVRGGQQTQPPCSRLTSPLMSAPKPSRTHRRMSK